MTRVVTATLHMTLHLQTPAMTTNFPADMSSRSSPVPNIGRHL